MHSFSHLSHLGTRLIFHERSLRQFREIPPVRRFLNDFQLISPDNASGLVADFENGVCSER